MYQINAGPQTDAFRFGRVSFIELVLGQPGIDFLEKGLAASVEIFAKILDMVFGNARVRSHALEAWRLSALTVDIVGERYAMVM